METILIVDDTKTNIEIVMDLLDEDYDILAAVDGKSAIEIAQEENPNLILLDIMMPKMDGFEVCKRLKGSDETKDIPIIFLSAKNDENSIELAYDIGGSDYVTKPFRPRELRARVKRELELVNLQKELEYLSLTDPMTNLYNRRYFTHFGKELFSIAYRDKLDLSLIIVDIDKFKNINDTYGHKIGDEVIIEFAKILEKNKREGDIICRFGGEEFVILLPQTDISSANIIAEDLRKTTQHSVIEFDLNRYLQFTISLGVSSILENEKDMEKMLKRADKALYEAKGRGRNRVCMN